jgi:hypothetical protein
MNYSITVTPLVTAVLSVASALQQRQRRSSSARATLTV